MLWEDSKNLSNLVYKERGEEILFLLFITAVRLYASLHLNSQELSEKDSFIGIQRAEKAKLWIWPACDQNYSEEFAEILFLPLQERGKFKTFLQQKYSLILVDLSLNVELDSRPERMGTLKLLNPVFVSPMQEISFKHNLFWIFIEKIKI